MTGLPPCPGTHLPPAKPGAEELRWIPDHGRSDRVRVLAHTCTLCRVVSYELCSAGGLHFIRRIERTRSDAVMVRETERLPAARMEPIWARLLKGNAR
ncbi:hypothetical protein [Sphaerimonospora thailandensis]|uniref:Uncharacterized protein n=1 Tax=Sphaerimonospora thailandensis TaxID=795644 RepID=A0A8J3R7H5_9ACTN|nr:hypothetical protein [Sphaerimonospora thailandensis]GIH69419.1 hypothetical protein Mth01_16720 [Sphaerimonospora thailandensis]